jgi:hypothetical protein
VIDVKTTRKTLPDSFYNPVPVNVAFSEIGKRDELYDR